MDVTMFPMPEWFVQGGPLMWPLLICSLLLTTITLERLLFWWRLQFYINDTAIKQYLARLPNMGTTAITSQSKDPALLMLKQAFSAAPNTTSELLENAAKHQLHRMQRGQPILDTIITLAPMLGILGTVLGIIESFQVLGGEGVPEPKVIIGGIAQALVSTAAGLSVAMLALLPFNRFRHLIQLQTLRLETVGTEVEALLFGRTDLSENPVQLKVISHAAR